MSVLPILSHLQVRLSVSVMTGTSPFSEVFHPVRFSGMLRSLDGQDTEELLDAA